MLPERYELRALACIPEKNDSSNSTNLSHLFHVTLKRVRLVSNGQSNFQNLLFWQQNIGNTFHEGDKPSIAKHCI